MMRMIKTAAAASQIRLRSEWRGFSIFLAETAAERELAFRIRHDVFLDELQGRPRADRQERDRFDEVYDQLLVTVTETGEPVGTSRLATSAMTGSFYTGTEFDLGGFLARPGLKMEIGRVCLCRSWRRNISLAALARGMGMYARQSGAEWVFGCSSIPTTDAAVAAILHAHFGAMGACAHGFGVSPLAPYAIPGFAGSLARLDPTAHLSASVESLVPPLLKLYLKSGAGIGSEPALDRAFGCLDFFTVLSIANHNNSVLGRYIQC
jgi:putative hemolysin